MRRVIAPALLAVFVFAGSSADAGFGLFDRLCGSGCNTGCDVGCADMYMGSACGCEIAPACGCEPVSCCAPKPKFGHKLRHFFGNHTSGCCDVAPACGPICEPACGCEVAPVDCGCAVIEPACGCEAAPCCAPKRKFGGMFKKLFHKHNACCEPVCEPACGCEMAPSCGCGF